MNANGALAAIPPAANTNTEPTLAEVLGEVRELRAELAELRAHAATLVAAAQEAQQLIAGKGIMGLLGFGG